MPPPFPYLALRPKNTQASPHMSPSQSQSRYQTGAQLVTGGWPGTGYELAGMILFLVIILEWLVAVRGHALAISLIAYSAYPAMYQTEARPPVALIHQQGTKNEPFELASFVLAARSQALALPLTKGNQGQSICRGDRHQSPASLVDSACAYTPSRYGLHRVPAPGR